MATYIDDITWDAMSSAGIDITKVSRHVGDDGTAFYDYTDGDLRVAFGPGEPPGGGEGGGYDIAAYERRSDEDGGYWAEVGQNWLPTVAGLLDDVLQWIHS